MTQTIDTIRLKRGTSTNVTAASLERGEPAVALDKKELWVGDGVGNVKITDVLFYNSYSNLPTTGQENKIYIIKDTGSFYIWDPTLPGYKKYENESGTALVYCRSRGNTLVTFPSSYQNLNFPINDITTESSKLYQDPVNQDRFYIQESGYYRINYDINVQVSSNSGSYESINSLAQSRLIIDNSSVIQSSYDENANDIYFVITELVNSLNNNCIQWIDAGSYVSLQIQGLSSSNETISAKNYVIQIYKVDFVKGDVGSPGTPGSIWYNGSGIPNLSIGDNNDYYLDNDNGDVYQKISGSWVNVSNIKGPIGLSGDSSDVPYVQTRRSTNLILTDSWTNIELDVNDLTTDTSIIEQDSIDSSKINIKEDGIYEIDYGFTVSPSSGFVFSYSQVIINGTTVIPSSEMNINVYQNEVQDLKRTFRYLLSAGDYLQLQIRRSPTNSVELQPNLIFSVSSVKGLKGDKGDQGDRGEPFKIDEYIDFDEAKIIEVETTSGASSSDVYYLLVLDDTRIDNTTPSSLNGDMSNHVLMYDGTDWYDFGPFTGVEGPPGIPGPPGSGLSEYFNGESESLQQTTNGQFQNKLRLNITGLVGGDYRIGFYYEWNYNNRSQDFVGRVRIDDSLNIMEHQQEPKDLGTDQYHPVSGFKNITLTSGDHYIDIDWCCSNLGDTASIRRARLEFWSI